jgi:hypothetical protein
MRAIPSGKPARPRLPAGYPFVFLVLPIALTFGSFVPTWFLALALARAMGIPDHAPVRDQPLGWLWFGLFLAMMWGFLVGGAVCGSLLNVFILHSGLGYSWAGVRRADVCPRWLVDWLESRRAGSIVSKARVRKLHEDPLYDPLLDGLARRLRPGED